MHVIKLEKQNKINPLNISITDQPDLMAVENRLQTFLNYSPEVKLNFERQSFKIDFSNITIFEASLDILSDLTESK